MTEQQFNDLPELMKVKQVAAILNITPDTVLEMVKTGRILPDEVFQPTPNAHKRIRKSAIKRILKFNAETPIQKVYEISKRTADNLEYYCEYDIQNGLARAYARYRVSKTDEAHSLGFSIITDNP